MVLDQSLFIQSFGLHEKLSENPGMLTEHFVLCVESLIVFGKFPLENLNSSVREPRK